MTHSVYQTVMNHFRLKTLVGHFLIPLFFFPNTHESGEKRHNNLRGKLRLLLQLRLLESTTSHSSIASETSSIVAIAWGWSG